MSIPQLPADKANHHMYGTWAAIIGGGATRAMFGRGWIGAMALTVIVAAAKELYDWATGKGHPEWGDFAATCAGSVPVVAAFAATEG